MTFKGTVFKVKQDTLIVMTGDFEFKEIKKKKAEVGQEILFNEKDIKRPDKKRFNMAAVACVLVLFLIAGSILYRASMPGAYAYVSMDINPTIELALDDDYNVMNVKAGNQDGEDIIKELSLKGLNSEEAVQKIINTCSSLGYLNENNSNVFLTTTVIKGKRNEQISLEEKLVSSARNELENNRYDSGVYAFEVSPEKRKKAQQKGVSTSQYVLWDEMRENNINMELEEVSSQNINNIVNKNKNIQESIEKSAAAKWRKGMKKGEKDSGERKGWEKGNAPPHSTPPGQENAPPGNNGEGMNNNQSQENNKPLSPGNKGGINQNSKNQPPGLMNNKDKTPPGLDKEKPGKPNSGVNPGGKKPGKN